MTTTLVDVPSKFFHDLGGMHDSKLQRLSWDSVAGLLTIVVDDLNANFRGLPEYRGRAPAVITWSGVTRLSMDCSTKQDCLLRIFELECKDLGSQLSIVLLLTPHGRVELECQSAAVEYQAES